MFTENIIQVILEVLLVLEAPLEGSRSIGGFSGPSRGLRNLSEICSGPLGGSGSH